MVRKDWEKVGLKAGKIAEVAYCIIAAVGSGFYPVKATKPSNFLVASTQIEQKFPKLSRALKIQIPRALIAIYELRNNRSVGHVGGVVNPNEFDGEYFFRSTKWIVCELSRALCEWEEKTGSKSFYNTVNTSEVPIIWEFDDIVRVLNPDLASGDKVTLVLAHHGGTWLSVPALQDAVEYKNSTDFKRKVLRKLHDRKLIEYDIGEQRAMALPAAYRRARELHR